MALPQENKIYTYADYLEWDLPEGERYELIDGVPYAMAAPTIKHQSVSVELVYYLRRFLEGKDCKVYHAPIDVCLFDMAKQDKNVFQPDIIVVCDKKKLEDGKRCNGAPEFVVEILSPSTATLDLLYKMDKYFQAGVREYWIVDPDKEVVCVRLFEDGKMTSTHYDKTQTVPVTILEGCEINLNEVFS